MSTPRMIDIPIVEIDPEFQALIPIMVKEEKDALEASLLAEGCRESIILWNTLIVDGHMRYALCQKNNIEFGMVHKEFESRDQAKIWIINNQFARRNLTPRQISYLRGLRQIIEKGENVGASEKLAKEYGVSSKTIERDAEFAEAVDKLSPEEKAAVLTGKQKKTKGELTGQARSVSSALDNLKRWYKKASPAERDQFIEWINDKGYTLENE